MISTSSIEPGAKVKTFSRVTAVSARRITLHLDEVDVAAQTAATSTSNRSDLPFEVSASSHHTARHRNEGEREDDSESHMMRVL